MDVEQFIRIDLRRRGWIDALFRNLVFEFKRDLERERGDGQRELRDYLVTLPNGAECVGLLTDGLRFEVYTLAASGLSQDDSFDLDAADPESAFLWLDAYLFSQRNTPPTSADLVRRFGLRSPSFGAANRMLHALLARLADSPTLEVKRRQWHALLSKVYGSDIADDTLFVRHTFLSQFAKLLAYAALTDGAPQGDALLWDIITGDAFHRFGVSNLGEIDFFAWILDDAVRDSVIAMLRRLADSLRVYDLSQINEDLLKQLYQDLVDPETRHELGEFYTPDWLAELTLTEIDYRSPQSLMDPSCGAGTFLFLAIRRLADQGLTGWALVDFALENIVGMDVHPLAVTISRTNYLLAISPHMRGSRTDGKVQLPPIPVYLADTLAMTEVVGPNLETLVVPVDRDRSEAFHIPADVARSPMAFTSLIEQMEEYARYSPDDLGQNVTTGFLRLVRERFGAAQSGIVDLSQTYWAGNLRLLNRLIAEGRNSIWAYLLKNTARPLLLAAQRFDVIAGNPPWLAYRYIQDKTYQAEVKKLTFGYGLLGSGDVKLFTTMDLSTLFMVHCEARYLRPGGTIAFVMPRSVLTGARQHRAFRGRGLTRVLDLRAVTPLFNTESCVLIRQADDLHTDQAPTTCYAAALPAYQMTLADARPYLTATATTTRLLGDVEVAGPYYYERFRQGATLMPRNLCFVRPLQNGGFSPAMATDPDADDEAKVPWKGVRLEGRVYPENLYATLLSKFLLPFGYQRLHLVALPVCLENSQLKIMREADFLANGRIDSWRTYFKQAEQKWDELKKGTSQFDDFIQRLDYQRNLTVQHPVGAFKVLYNTNGTHISSCVIELRSALLQVYGYSTRGFIADTKTYYYETDNSDEAHYLCALLNAPTVDEAIKAFQTRGLFGERDITRTPFEACAIPSFDAADPDHLALAQLSREAHAIIADIRPQGRVVQARRLAREAVAAQIAAIDAIARRVLGLSQFDTPH
ncbi:MAG: N-6 DNA methylase [Chloroflexi bacterium]|nr:N-6 DNA methylase [Chloroflexota bacterium]